MRSDYNYRNTYYLHKHSVKTCVHSTLYADTFLYLTYLCMNYASKVAVEVPLGCRCWRHVPLVILYGVSSEHCAIVCVCVGLYSPVVECHLVVTTVSRQH